MNLAEYIWRTKGTRGENRYQNTERCAENFAMRGSKIFTDTQLGAGRTGIGPPSPSFDPLQEARVNWDPES